MLEQAPCWSNLNPIKIEIQVLSGLRPPISNHIRQSREIEIKTLVKIMEDSWQNLLEKRPK